MRLLAVVTDSEAVNVFERTLIEHDVPFSVIPRVWGRGRTGLHAGDRVHPGGSALLFTVVDDARVEETTRLFRAARDVSGAAALTRIFSLPAEEIG